MNIPPRWRYKLHARLAHVLKRRGKAAFLGAVAPAGKVLDVGCGNDSPLRFKATRPDIHYIGLDIGDYNQSASPSLVADSYIVTSPERFATEIRSFSGQLEAVVSSHNLEHCNEPEAVLEAMVAALKAGGTLFIAFPCEESVHFPSRPHGCLNFHDDSTHRIPPDFRKVCALLESHGMRIDFASKRYRPKLLFALGLVLEPLGALLGRAMPAGSTWALYGFESIIWATREP